MDGNVKSYDKINEALVFYGLGSDAEEESLEVYEKLVSSNKAERGFLFDSGYTHVGISCGCNAQYDDMCCFGYGKNVVDESSVKTPDITLVS